MTLTGGISGVPPGTKVPGIVRGWAGSSFYMVIYMVICANALDTAEIQPKK